MRQRLIHGKLATRIRIYNEKWICSYWHGYHKDRPTKIRKFEMLKEITKCICDGKRARRFVRNTI